MISWSPGLHGVSSLHGRAMMPYRREIDHPLMRGVVGLIELHRLGYRPNIVRPPVLLLVVNVDAMNAHYWVLGRQRV